MNNEMLEMQKFLTSKEILEITMNNETLEIQSVSYR